VDYRICAPLEIKTLEFLVNDGQSVYQNDLDYSKLKYASSKFKITTNSILDLLENENYLPQENNSKYLIYSAYDKKFLIATISDKDTLLDIVESKISDKKLKNKTIIYHYKKGDNDLFPQLNSLSLESLLTFIPFSESTEFDFKIFINSVNNQGFNKAQRKIAVAIITPVFLNIIKKGYNEILSFKETVLPQIRKAKCDSYDISKDLKLHLFHNLLSELIDSLPLSSEINYKKEKKKTKAFISELSLNVIPTLNNKKLISSSLCRKKTKKSKPLPVKIKSNSLDINIETLASIDDKILEDSKNINVHKKTQKVKNVKKNKESIVLTREIAKKLLDKKIKIIKENVIVDIDVNTDVDKCDTIKKIIPPSAKMSDKMRQSINNKLNSNNNFSLYKKFKLALIKDDMNSTREEFLNFIKYLKNDELFNEKLNLLLPVLDLESTINDNVKNEHVFRILNLYLYKILNNKTLTTNKSIFLFLRKFKNQAKLSIFNDDSIYYKKISTIILTIDEISGISNSLNLSNISVYNSILETINNNEPELLLRESIKKGLFCNYFFTMYINEQLKNNNTNTCLQNCLSAKEIKNIIASKNDIFPIDISSKLKIIYTECSA
jgi:hypothetical protein